MTFAAELLLRSTLAEEEFQKDKAHFCQEADRLMDGFVDSKMREFQEACLNCADNRLTSIDTRLYCERSSLDTFFSPKFGISEIFAIASLTSRLSVKLAALGFAAVSVCAPSANYWPGNLCWAVYASWAGAPEGAEGNEPEAIEAMSSPPSAMSRGTPVDCPVCLQTCPGVALIPCGHTACSSCAGRLVSCSCPCCRQWVSGVTQSLFIN